MKSALIAMLLISPLFAQAQGAAAPAGAPAKEQKFEEHKKEALANIEKRIAAMNEHKSCVSAAKDKEAIRACGEKMRDFRMDMREERMDRRQEKMGERMKRMEERKEKMEERKEKSN